MKKLTQLVGVALLTLSLAFGTVNAAPKKATKKKVTAVKKAPAKKVETKKAPATPATPATPEKK